MQFAWIGFLKPGADPDPTVLQQLTGFLQQPYMPISSLGPLRDEAGHRAGMMMIFEAEDHAAAEALVADSPFRRAGLYEQYHLFEYVNEVG